MKFPIGFNIAYALCSFGLHFWFNIKTEGRENLPEDTAFIVAANHRTYVDPPLINVCIKRRFIFVAKKDLFRKPLFRWLITTLGAIPSTSDDPSYNIVPVAEKKMREDGKCLVIFPEGTRHRNGKIGRGHSGAVLMAAQMDMPIIPVGLCYGDKLHFRSKIKVKIGKPIKAEDFGCDRNSDSRALRPMRDDLMEKIKELVYSESIH